MFCHWNFNSILTRNKIKISLTKAYSSVFHYDLFSISESLLNKSIKDDEIHIEGFSKKYFVVITQVGQSGGGGGAISEISFGRKKRYFFIIAYNYRSPNQTDDEFDIFHQKLQDRFDSVKDENPHCIILKG